MRDKDLRQHNLIVPFPPYTSSENSEIERKSTDLLNVYTVDVCERKIEVTDEHYAFFCERLSACLRLHAEQSHQNINDLVSSLQEGRSSANGTALGGDPLRDIVLAAALLTKDSQAIMVFENDYLGYLTGIASRVHPHFGKNSDEWWNEFLDFLAGYSHSNGKLKTYCGRSALRFWLRVVLWNFLRRRPIPRSAPEITEHVSPNETDHIELNESITLFADLVRDSLQAMPDRDRLLLSMIYIDNLLKKDIAAVFRVHPGQIGRWESNALQTFRKELCDRLEKLPHKDVHEEIMGGIVNNPKEFAEALIIALKQMSNKS